MRRVEERDRDIRAMMCCQFWRATSRTKQVNTGAKAPVFVASRKVLILAIQRYICFTEYEVDILMLDKLKPPPKEMEKNAGSAASFLKTLAHEGRLMILCHLGSGEKSVGELEEILNCRQAAVSQMLARLRDDGMVATRRDGKTIYYSLADDNTAKLIDLLYNMFCSVNAKDAAQ
jgi:DNA-binding transcriptional ArsR family regulator